MKGATVNDAERNVNETIKYSFTVWTLVSSFIVSSFVINGGLQHLKNGGITGYQLLIKNKKGIPTDLGRG